MHIRPTTFNQRLLTWFDFHGRHNLPWQKNPTPYRVWLSEIMLQQTQVSTAIPYYLKFLKTFPTLKKLAQAPLDEVLHLWTGLGYYARARNLHRCAQIITREYAGKFPNTLDTLCSLPGIGQSTAGAILSIGFEKRAPILDGNVKRVLARFFVVEGSTSSLAVQNQLWQYAEALTPQNRVADYTQAIMDLGATLCTRSKPNCPACPLTKICLAFAQQRTHELPTPKVKKSLPNKKRYFLLLQTPHGILLTKRPPQGIWGGLWSLPEFATKTALKKFQLSFVPSPLVIRSLPSRQHTFSHYHLEMLITHVSSKTNLSLVEPCSHWYNIHKPAKLGLAAPIKQLLKELKE